MTSTSALPRPRSCSESELNKVGVTLIDDPTCIRLKCQRCGYEWVVDHLPGRRRFRGGFRICPDGCNDSRKPTAYDMLITLRGEWITLESGKSELIGTIGLIATQIIQNSEVRSIKPFESGVTMYYETKEHCKAGVAMLEGAVSEVIEDEWIRVGVRDPLRFRSRGVAGLE